jgi:hypothetical protein
MYAGPYLSVEPCLGAALVGLLPAITTLFGAARLRERTLLDVSLLADASHRQSRGAVTARGAVSAGALAQSMQAVGDRIPRRTRVADDIVRNLSPVSVSRLSRRSATVEPGPVSRGWLRGKMQLQ